MILGTLTNRFNDSIDEFPREPTIFGRWLSIFSVNAVIFAVTIQKVIRIKLLNAAEYVSHKTGKTCFKPQFKYVEIFVRATFLVSLNLL